MFQLRKKIVLVPPLVPYLCRVGQIFGANHFIVIVVVINL